MACLFSKIILLETHCCCLTVPLTYAVTSLQILSPDVRLRVHNCEEPAAPVDLRCRATVIAYFESLCGPADVTHFELASAETPGAQAGFSLFWHKVQSLPSVEMQPCHLSRVKPDLRAGKQSGCCLHVRKLALLLTSYALL